MSIALNDISKSVGGRTLFDHVTISFNRGKRYAVTGPNGSGKSTLLKVMMGQEAANSGTVSLPKSTQYLKQNIEEFKDYKVLDTVIMGNARLWKALEERDHLYALPSTDEIGMRLAEIEEIIGEEDGYVAEGVAEELLLGIGVPKELHQLPMKAIATDLQFRALLAQALFGNPQALLLDEPTNHLDLESIKWLEEFLHNYQGTLIVISHDRHFLNSVATDIADIDYETIIVYPGNYDQMVVAKSSVRERIENENKSKEKKAAQLKEFVARFGAGTRASQVQSRLRELEKLQPQELKKSNIQRPYIRFLKPQKASGEIVMKIDQISKAFGDKKLITKFSTEILRGDKIGVIGNNGLGKTTLIKMLANRLAPDNGKIVLGHEVKISYFPQNHAEIIPKGDPRTVFDYLRQSKEKTTDEEIRSVLGKLLFSGDDAFKKVATLSGGETARLILCHMLLEDHNVIVLDEPNNHLDLEAVSALAWALEEYPGTVIAVSHDRDLVDRFAKKLIVFEEGNVKAFAETLEEHLAKKGK